MPSSAPRPSIAIIGAGRAGRTFAGECAQAGYSVVLEDVMPSNLRHAEAQLAELGHTVRFASTVEDAVREADVAVDFMPDDLESKLEIFSMIDRMAPPRTVMLTPSQTLSITDLASCTYRPDRCIMVRDLDSASPRLLTAAACSRATREVAETLLTALRGQATVEADPDLPMLLKNMKAATL